MSISIQYTAQKNVQKRKTLNMQQNTLNKQDNVHTNTESIQCISIVYSKLICPYKYNQWAIYTGRKKSNSL